jgi:N6-adenosine-specific RNA methylase IME4
VRLIDPEHGVMTPAERQRRRRARIGTKALNKIRRQKAKAKRQLVTSATKRAQRELRLFALVERTMQARVALEEAANRYNVVLADPPWDFQPYSRITGMNRSAENHYPVMDLDSIKALKIPVANDCVLFLWATVPMLPQALEVMTAWGFTYRSHYVWLKDRIGTGYWNRNRHELLLVGVRGTIPAPLPGTQPVSVIAAPVGRHSEKPVVFHELIEKLYPNVPKLEMFARTQRAGWDVWGAEAPTQDEQPTAHTRVA